jgi:hypothetical protein
VFIWRSYKENLAKLVLCVSTFWHFLLRTAFYRHLFPSPFQNKVRKKDKRPLQYVGRTKRVILLQLSGTADRTFHFYYLADKTGVLLCSFFKHSIQVKYVNLRTDYGFRAVWSHLLMAMISRTHKRNSSQQLIVQRLKSHSTACNYYQYLLILESFKARIRFK